MPHDNSYRLGPFIKKLYMVILSSIKSNIFDTYFLSKITLKKRRPSNMSEINGSTSKRVKLHPIPGKRQSLVHLSYSSNYKFPK